MMHRFTHVLSDLAILILPRARREWGDAMQAELAYADNDRSAALHAGGYVLAAVKARMRDFDSRFAAGVSAVALVSGVSALLHIGCAVHGIHVLSGGPDGFLDSLRRSGRVTPMLVANYRSTMPLVVACLFALGAAHLAATGFLFRRQFSRFLAASCIALLAASAAVVVQLSVVWTLNGVPSEFVALLVQMMTLPPLLLWSNGRHRHERTPT